MLCVRSCGDACDGGTGSGAYVNNNKNKNKNKDKNKNNNNNNDRIQRHKSRFFSDLLTYTQMARAQ